MPSAETKPLSGLDVDTQTPDTPPGRALHVMLAALLLVAMFGVMVGSALQKTPVVGEAQHVARGWAFWQTGQLAPADTLPLPDIIAGLGGLLEPTLQTAGPGTLAADLLWSPGVETARAVFLFRVPVMLLALLLGAVVWRWAYDLHGPWGAALALALTALSPNILAYARLATPDLARAAFFIGALFTWSRYLHRQTLPRLAVAGLALGLALAAGFATLLLIPPLIFMAVWNAGRHQPLRLDGAGVLSRVANTLGRWPLGWLWSALLVLLILATLASAVLAGVLAATRQPDVLAAYAETLTRFLTESGPNLQPYLLGGFRPEARYYDSFIILGLKLPLPTLALLLAAVTLLAARRPSGREWEVIFPALVFLAASLVDPLGPQLRYLLPLLVLLMLFTARLGGGPSLTGWLRPALVGWLVTSLAIINVVIYPNLLTYFNLIGGGPDNASRLLVGPNSDWGQDLGALASYLQERGAGTIRLSIFGDTDPARYGIDYVALPGSTQPGVEAVDFHPLNPPPGLYAISATNLAGAPDGLAAGTFGYFFAHEPIERVGESIYIYEVASAVQPSTNGSMPWLAQCADDMPIKREDELTRLTGLPELRTFAFDCESSLAFWEGPGWLALPADVEPIAGLGSPVYLGRDASGETVYRVWRAGSPPEAPRASVEFPPVTLPLPIAGYVELLGWETSAGSVSPGGELLLTTWWRVRDPPSPPVSIFARLLLLDGREIASADALGVPAEHWTPGMILVQQHLFTLEADVLPGSTSLITGLYSPATGRRFPVFRSEDRVIDRVVLRGIEVRE